MFEGLDRLGGHHQAGRMADWGEALIFDLLFSFQSLV